MMLMLTPHRSQILCTVFVYVVYSSWLLEAKSRCLVNGHEDEDVDEDEERRGEVREEAERRALRTDDRLHCGPLRKFRS